LIGGAGRDALIGCGGDTDADFDFAVRITDGAILAGAYTAVDFALRADAAPRRPLAKGFLWSASPTRRSLRVPSSAHPARLAFAPLRISPVSR